MIFVLACCVAVCFGVSVYLLLSKEMKGVAMGVFLLGHAANLAILAVSGSPLVERGFNQPDAIRRPPVSDAAFDTGLRSGEVAQALDVMVDPLPQALILTAIVIGFAVMGLALTLLVVTSRGAGTLSVAGLAEIRTGGAGDADGPGLDGRLETPATRPRPRPAAEAELEPEADAPSSIAQARTRRTDDASSSEAADDASSPGPADDASSSETEESP